jgi:primosomal protein N' (replication factor Y)
MYAQVLLAKPARSTQKIFHYSVPQLLIERAKIGSEVLIPFGKRRDKGYIVGFSEKAEVEKVKDILDVVSDEPIFTEKQIELARWMADYYDCFLMTALGLMLAPKGKNPKFEIINSKQIQNSKIQILNIILTDEQKNALQGIETAIDQKKTETFLLYGVTGSGKTEVYMRAIAKVLELGRSAIVLVPEIALTPQMVERFEERFPGQVAVLHSDLTLKQRREAWEAVAREEKKIVLGARSALFAPVRDIGIIVIDEEYEHSYKQDKSPRYHARETALKLADLHSAVVILGSATPALETFFKAEQGEYRKLTLSQRVEKRPLPEVEIVDMRREKGCTLSVKLREELQKTLAAGEKAILFLNRRGYFTFIMCQACGFGIECPTCSVALNYQSSDKKLHCNHCGYSQDPARSCPRCNSLSLRYFGTGTQRIENEVTQVFPEAKILRYDRDTVSKRGAHEAFFAAFAKGAANVLIGTQMVAKGLDIAHVTLVGVISADTGLKFPDFRAAEHTFQLLTQVAGRAGRHHLPGKVIIQSFTPEHYAIQAAAKHDYEGFYRQELVHRQELNYPPFSKLISLVIAGKNSAQAAKIADDLAQCLKDCLADGILGPAAAVLSKLRGEYRYRILIKGPDLEVMRQAIRDTLTESMIPSDVKVVVDVEPVGML